MFWEIFNNLFYANYIITRIPPISFEKCTNISATFYGCTSLETIEKLIFKADGTNTIDTVSYNLPFGGGCKKLKYIEIEGVIGCSISFRESPLTLESATSVLNHLKNYAGTSEAFVYSVTFSSDTMTALNNAGAIFNGMNWGDYLDSIGWGY